MQLKLTAYGIAREIMDGTSTDTQVGGVHTIADLKAHLISTYPAFAELLSFSLAVGEEYRDDGYVLSDGDEVVIIPPVSGG